MADNLDRLSDTQRPTPLRNIYGTESGGDTRGAAPSHRRMGRPAGTYQERNHLLGRRRKKKAVTGLAGRVAQASTTMVATE